MPDCFEYWRLVTSLPYYQGAVFAGLGLLREAVSVDQEMAPVSRPAPAPSIDPEDDSPPARTNLERQAAAKGEQIREVPIETAALLSPGMISFGKG